MQKNSVLTFVAFRAFVTFQALTRGKPKPKVKTWTRVFDNLFPLHSCYSVLFCGENNKCLGKLRDYKFVNIDRFRLYLSGRELGNKLEINWLVGYNQGNANEKQHACLTLNFIF